MATATMEDRIAALENEVARLRREIRGNRPGVIGKTRPDFLDMMYDIHANSPNFADFAAHLTAEREREREEVQRLATDDEES